MINPILGYEHEKKFVIIEHKEQSKFRWLQSVVSPEIAFVVTVPGLFDIDYSFELPERTQEDLDINCAEDILALNIVVIPSENPRESTINMLAPLVFNINNRKGTQIVLAGTNFKVDFPLFKQEAVC
jgi:flagellar assembly factor FliW